MKKLATITGILLSFAAFAQTGADSVDYRFRIEASISYNGGYRTFEKGKTGIPEQDVFFNSRKKVFIAADLPEIRLIFRERWEAIGCINFIEYGLDRDKIAGTLKRQFAGSYFEEEPQYENRTNSSFEHQVFTLGAGYLFRKKKNRFHAYLLAGYGQGTGPTYSIAQKTNSSNYFSVTEYSVMKNNGFQITAGGAVTRLVKNKSSQKHPRFRNSFGLSLQGGLLNQQSELLYNTIDPLGNSLGAVTIRQKENSWFIEAGFSFAFCWVGKPME